MNWLKIAKTFGPYLIIVLLACALVLQQATVKSVKADLKLKTGELTTCQDANKTNQQTIGTLKKEISDTLTGCDKRLQSKNKVISNIRKIDSIPVAGGTNNETNIPGGSADPLLDMLNGMFDSGNAADSKN